MKSIIKPFVFFFIVTSLYNTYGQIRFSGKVYDEMNQPLSGATVLLKSANSTSIIGYDVTNTQGLYSINVDRFIDSLTLNVSFLGYQKIKGRISSKSQNIDFTLIPSTEKLREVFIEQKEIDKRGDTINYSVSAFKDKNDRVISDVLKKMPGIEILQSGQILYQGKAIEKYYIEGLDLLEGKYNLANENISADDVLKVQILENHQHIKLLDSLTYSDKASLNIQLKNGVSISGSSIIGLGMEPFLWQAELTPMMFSKKSQGLASYQGNNVGKNLERQLIDFSMNNSNSSFDITKNNLLSTSTLTTPSISERYWFNNLSNIASINILKKTKNDFHLKLNLSYFKEEQKQQGETLSKYFTSMDTIDLRENSNNYSKKSNFDAKFTLEKNAKSIYVKNSTRYTYNSSSINSTTDQTDTIYLQELNDPFTSISNQLMLITSIGQQLLEFNSSIGYSALEEQLEVMVDPINEETYSNAQRNQQDQRIKFSTDNYFSLTKLIGQWTFRPSLGYSINQDKLKSNLYVSYLSVSDNNLDYARKKIYYNNALSYSDKKEVIHLDLDLPISYLKIDTSELYSLENQYLNQWVFEPDVNLNLKLNRFWRLSLYSKFENQFGNLNNLYPNFILTNYRTLTKFDAQIRKEAILSYGARLKYRNTLKRMFMNFNYNKTFTSSNLQYSTEIDENGNSVIQTIEHNNIALSENSSIGVSKYLKPLSSTLKLNFNQSKLSNEQKINDVNSQVKNQTMNYRVALETNFFTWLDIQFSANMSVFNTEVDSQKLQKGKNIKQELTTYFSLSKNQDITFKTEYFRNSISNLEDVNYYFDLGYKYNFHHSGIEIGVNWYNISNSENFITIYSDNFSYVASSFKLRPSQIMMNIRFGF